MATTNDINQLFINTLAKSYIKRTFVNGFDKYIIYNDDGTLFVIGFNKETNKYGFGRTPLMLAQYKRANLPVNVLPDYPALYLSIVRVYKIYKEVEPLFDLIDHLSGKKR